MWTEGIDHVKVIFRTGPQATNMVLTDELAPTVNMMVTPALEKRSRLQPVKIYQ